MKFLWLFDADAIWILIPIAAALWALGGSGIKPLRRAGVSILISLAALSLGLPGWLALIQNGVLFAALSLGYGDDLRKSIGAFYYPLLFVIGAAWCAALFPLAIWSSKWMAYGVMIAVSGILFGGTTYSSQKFDFPRWKWCEMLTGAVLGLAAALLLAR